MESLPTPLKLKHEIRVEDVSFTYPGRRSPALEDVSLRIRRGSRVAIVGRTGSGKSTLADLLMGLLDPSSGRISIDGIMLDRSTRAAWHRSIAHVPQSAFLADTTIARNIAFGARETEIDLDRVRAAAKHAQLDGFVAQLPDGYDTLIGERGIGLSGGQRQRLAIARAFYKDAPVVVLDEATSALDDETEAAILASLDAMAKQGRTIIVIAHRPTSIVNCDVVIRLDEGRLVAVESGALPMPARLACAGSREHRLQRLEEDQHVEPGREVLDIVEVVLELEGDLIDPAHIALVDLSPAGNSGFHDIAVAVKGDARHKERRKALRLGTRPDPAHLAAQDVEDLGKLVEAGLAKKRSEPGDPRVGMRRGKRLLRVALLLGQRLAGHGPEFVDQERRAGAADSQLLEQGGPAVMEADHDRDDHDYRQHERRDDQRRNPVDEGFKVEIAAARYQHAEAVFRQMVDLDSARERFSELFGLVDHEAGHRGVGKHPFPIVGDVFRQVDDQRIVELGFLQRRSRERHPLDAPDAGQIVHLPDWNDADPQAKTPLDQEPDR